MQVNIVHRRGHGVDEYDKSRAEAIPEAGLRTRHGRAQRDAQHQRHAHGKQTQDNRYGRFLRNDAADGRTHAVAGRGAQIAVQQTAKEAEQLLMQRLIQTQLRQARSDHAVVELIKIIKVSLNRHLAQQNKHYRQNHQQRQHGGYHSFQ